MTVRKLGWLSLVSVIAFGWTGCGDDDSTADDDVEDSGPATDSPMGSDAGLPVAQFGDVNNADPNFIDPATAMNADYSCLGAATAPTAGDSIDFEMLIHDFQNGEDDPTPNVCVEIYTDNVVPVDDECTGDTTDSEGHLTVTAPASGWFAYRVFPNEDDGVAGSIQYNENAPSSPSGSGDGVSVSESTLALIPAVLGLRREAGTSIVAGRVFDCADNDIYGTHVRIKLEDGTYIDEGDLATDPHYRYFNGDSGPDDDQPWTHVDGLYGVINVPAMETPVTVEAWGVPAGSTEQVLLGCEQGLVLPDTITVLNIGPLRSDGSCGSSE